MRELYINGFQIDLYSKDDNPIATSYQINNIGEFEDVQANFSNTFSVPKTENNVSRLGNSDQIATGSLIPYRKNPARYLNNGIDIVDNGYAIIEDAGEEFDITILSGNFDLFSQIGDKKISDIDVSELDHVFNIDNLLTLNSADGDVIWPLVQLGGYDNSGTIDIRWQQPALKHSYLLSKIFEGTTWGFSGAIFSEDKYRKLIFELLSSEIVSSQEVLDSQSARIGNDTFTMPYQPAGSSGNTFFSFLGSSRFDDLTLPNFDSTAGYLDKSNSSIYRYVAQKEVIIDIEFNLFFNYNGLTPFYIYRNSSIPGFTGGTLVWSSFGQIPIGHNYFNSTISGIRLAPGESLVIITRGGLVGSPAQQFYSDGTIIGQPSNKSYIKFVSKQSATIGGTVHYNSLLPNMKQADFIKQLCNKFGLLVQPNFKTNKIEFKQHKSIRESNKIVDWSNKIDTNYTPKISFRRSEFGQQTWLRWGQEDDRGTIGDGYFNIDDTVLEYSKDLFKLDFNSSLQYLINDVNGFLCTGVEIKRYTRAQANNYSSQTVFNTGDTTLYNSIVYEYISLTPSSGTIPTNTSKWRVYPFQFVSTEESTNRLLYYNICGEFYLIDGLGNSIGFTVPWPVAYFADSSQPFDLDFTNIIQREYAPFVAMMQKYKQSDVHIRLSEIDIQNLDFFVLYAIESLGNLFYLMLVDEYESEEPSTICTLIRI